MNTPEPHPGTGFSTAPSPEPNVPHKSSGARWALALIGLSALGGIGFWVQRAMSPKAPAGTAAADRPIPVSAAMAETRDVPLYVEGVGNAVPLAQVTVRTLVDGRLDKVTFTEGQTVKKGDLLALVDPRPFAIQLQTAQAALARDIAQAKESKVNLERYKQMRDQGIGSQQQVDDQQATAVQNDATVHSDQAQIGAAQLNLDYAHITSPIDGVTGIRVVDSGNLVHVVDPNGIVVVTQLDPITIIFNLPQDDLPRVSAALAAGEVPVVAFSRDGTTELGSGKLSLIDNTVNQTTATVRLKATMPNPQSKLWPNQFVKARALLATVTGATVIPAVAVQRGPTGLFVYVVGADQTVTQTPVELVSTQGDISIVQKGVTAGQQVVTDGANQLRTGTKVITKPHESKAQEAAAPASSSSAAAP